MNVKELRTAAGMTQKAFAEYFGISKRAIEEWEGGRRNCPEYLLNLMTYKLEKEGLIVLSVDAGIDNVRHMGEKIILE